MEAEWFDSRYVWKSSLWDCMHCGKQKKTGKEEAKPLELATSSFPSLESVKTHWGMLRQVAKGQEHHVGQCYRAS